LGLHYRVISGETEARLSFAGALALLPDVPRAVVFDIGGGSTEIVAGASGGAPEVAVSLDIGTVRLTERHGAVPPVGVETLTALRTDVSRALESVPPEAWTAGPLIGTGSTSTVVAHLAGTTDVPLAAVRTSREQLADMTPEAITALAPEVMHGRADVALTALCIVEGVVVASGAEAFMASRGGLRHGLALAAR
jgi:exopolyphosphatase/guanosine-5'-triphosphate,3'-diphosphate pyrophosphatase